MKRIKVGIILTMILLLLIMIIMPYNMANAETTSLNLGLLLYRKTGNGYTIGDGTVSSGNAKIVWKIASYDDTNISAEDRYTKADYSKNIYCLDAGKGFITENQYYTSDIANYTYHKNMYTEKAEVLSKWNQNKTSVEITSSTYNKILWIIDHMYVPTGDTEKDKLQKQALFSKIVPDKNNPNRTLNDWTGVENLTDEIIEVVQQLAIWNYTNSNDSAYNQPNGQNIFVGTKDSNGEFVQINHEDDESEQYCADELYKYLINNADENYTENDSSLAYSTTVTFWANENNTNQPVVIIERTPKQFDLSLRKRVTKIEKTDGTTQNLAVNRTNADESSRIRNMTIETDNLDNGTDTTAEYKHRKDPITIDTGDKVTYTITIFNEGDIDGRATEITDQLPTGLKFLKTDTENTYSSENYTYTYNEETNTIIIKESSAHDNLKAYTKNGTLDSTEIHVICEVTKERENSEKILTNVAWISKDYNESGVADRDSQPDVKPNVNKDNMENYKGTTAETDLSKNTYYPGQQDDDDFDKLVLPSKEKIFDLALRKYITKVETINADGTRTTNDIEKSSTISRNPDVDTSTLENGTTATYKHKKDPVLVKTGDLVTYNITVYNEGEKIGRAIEITDQLPTGLKFNSEETMKLAENAGYTFDYDTTNNKLIITETTGSTHSNLDVYNTETKKLDSNTIKVVCTVEETASDKEKILTNIAYISKEYNAQDNLTITNQRYEQNNKADRDSEPSNYPNKTSTELKTGDIGYTGKDSYTKTELSDNNKYYKGQQDDDDFEKIKLLPSEIDLALRKFITEVSSKGTVKTITNREPKVDTSTIATTGTATYNHTKEPVSVRIGDIVTYTIRVYNEGGLDSYASEITDHLPEWLEFIKQDNSTTDEEKEAAEFNTNYLWTVSNDGRTITTNITSKKNSDVYSTLTGIERKDTLLKAFDGGETLDYLDVKVKCKVKSVASGMKITNIADITKMENKDGEEVTKDRDSEIDNVVLPDSSNLPNYRDDQIGKKDYIPGQEDDDDFEKVIVQIFDLALRKFITAVDDTSVSTRYPQVSYDSEKEKITYTHPKDPVGVKNGNLVTYTIRVYNEGDIAGYAKEVTDNLPDGLLYVVDNSINQKYRWKMLDKDGKETTEVKEAVYITTDYLSKEQEEETGRNNLLNAFDKKAEISDKNPDYKDLKVVFKVIEPNTSDRILINTAQISEDEDKDGNPIDDIDSIPNRDEDYNFDDETKNEDDIDIEKVKLLYFDLALRKFITAVDSTPVNNRYPSLSLDDNGKIVYTHTKTPVEVENGNIVTYTIRVYNEGNQNGYADEITDDMPEGLEFLVDNNINKEYRWKLIDSEGKETTDVSKAVKITTDYLSKAQQDETGRNNLIKAFDKEIGLTNTNPDYRDLKVAFKVTEPNTSDRILVNTAEISEDKDEDGKKVDDVDSTPGNSKEGEDDIDKEYVKVKYFDLALKKWVTQAIIIDGNDKTVIESGHTGDENPEPAVKVDLKEKKLNSVTVKFAYKIKVTNEGEIAGYAKEVKDHVPEGLEFIQEDNPDWYKCEDGTVATAKLANTLLQPGESATVEIVLEWINSSENMGQKMNYAEISKDYNDSNTPDIDSKPNNFDKKPVEDDEDEAPVILSIQTGEAIMYIGLTLVVLITLTSGILLIKKYVL